MVCDVKPIVTPEPRDCGPTCLKMLLDYYGKGEGVSIEDLIKDCNTGFIGVTGTALMRAGRKYGLDMRAWREIKPGEEVSPDALTIDVPTLGQDRPSIIWWRYNHWCICCGKDENGKVVVINPDRGRYRMSESTFKSWYTDISLTNGIPEKEAQS